MRIVISEFMSLDGVVQAPGGPEEDTDGGFAQGGWSHPFFDEVVGGAFDTALKDADALLFGRRTWQTMAGAWPERAGEQAKMLHFEVEVEDLEAAVDTALEAGGTEAPWQPPDRNPERIRIMLDPAGHPLCLFLGGE